jgi:hypothetical protein
MARVYIYVTSTMQFGKNKQNIASHCDYMYAMFDLGWPEHHFVSGTPMCLNLDEHDDGEKQVMVKETDHKIGCNNTLWW